MTWGQMACQLKVTNILIGSMRWDMDGQELCLASVDWELDCLVLHCSGHLEARFDAKVLLPLKSKMTIKRSVVSDIAYCSGQKVFRINVLIRLPGAVVDRRSLVCVTAPGYRKRDPASTYYKVAVVPFRI